MKVEWFSIFVFWNIFGAITILYFIFNLLHHMVSPRTVKVKTYTRELFEKLNAGFFIFLTLNIFSMNLGVPPAKGFALLLGLYGFWMLIYGTALNFRPSLIGAFITWFFAFASLFVKSNQFDLIMIFHALAVVFGYIIPGYLARKEFKKNNRNLSV